MDAVQVRPSALTQMPDGLDEYEHRAYVRGYADGCLGWVRKHGIPEGEDLHRATAEAEQARHPTAHRAGMRELRKHREKYPREERRVA